MWAAARPGYTAPTRKETGGRLLDAVHGEIISQVKDKLEDKDATLIQDGWSDLHKSPVIASSLYTQDKCHFLSPTDKGSNKKTASFCVQ